MITKEKIKLEIDRIDEKYLEILYLMLRSFERTEMLSKSTSPEEVLSWHDFIEATYGCLADDPMTRPDQGEFEIREELQ